MIGIVSLGTNNLSSLKNALTDINAQYGEVSDKTSLDKFDRFILPGVGSFDYCITELQSKPWLADFLNNIVTSGTPILGICIGFQLLLNASEEGSLNGLGLIDGKAKKLVPHHDNFKVPQIGWNSVESPSDDLKLLAGIENAKFYFMHSYAAEITDPGCVTATFNYNCNLCSIAEKQNIFGVQFHPEKSFAAGQQVLRNFNNI